MDGTRISDVAEMDQLDNQLLRYNPGLGLNIDSSYIINPEKLALAKQVNGNEGAIRDLANRYSTYPGVIRSAAKEELGKPQALVDKLAAIPYGCSFRVNCHAPIDPFTMRYCDENGAHFDKTAVSQLKSLRDKTGDNDILMAVNPYTKEKGLHVPDTPEEKAAYLQSCKGVLDAIGKDGGSGVLIEFGNEMNASQETRGTDGGLMFAGNEGFPRKPVDPVAYADWYYDTVTSLKEEYPDVKCKLTGTCFYDEEFLGSVIDEISKKPNGCDTIDAISWHPYRCTSLEGTTVMHDGSPSNEHMSYKEQAYRMRALADAVAKLRTDGKSCEAITGEISYYQPDQHGKSIDFEQMGNEQQLSKATGMKSYIWPSVSMTNASRYKQVQIAAKREYDAEMLTANVDAPESGMSFE